MLKIKTKTLHKINPKAATSIFAALALVLGATGLVDVAKNFVNAAASDYSLSGATVSLDGTSDGTATVNFKTNPGGTFYALQGIWSTKETGSTSHLQLSNVSLNSGLTRPSELSANTGSFIWYDGTDDGVSISANGGISSATYKVDKNTPAGTYQVTLDVKALDGGATRGRDSEMTNKQLTANVTVTRVADAPYVYTLSYDANGGEGTIDSQTCSTSGASCTIVVSDSQPSRTGYTFLGWADTADSTTATYHSGDSITLSADKTIFAIWQAINNAGDDNTDTDQAGDSNTGSTGGLIVPNTGAETNSEQGISSSVAAVTLPLAAISLLLAVRFFRRSHIDFNKA